MSCAEIPYGRAISYAVLARRIGQPSASRAVGGANGQNPVSIIVPCHRVIGADGGLGGYGGGLDRKRWLLELEAEGLARHPEWQEEPIEHGNRRRASSSLILRNQQPRRGAPDDDRDMQARIESPRFVGGGLSALLLLIITAGAMACRAADSAVAGQEPADPLETLNNSSRMLYAQAKAMAMGARTRF